MTNKTAIILGIIIIIGLAGLVWWYQGRGGASNQEAAIVNPEENQSQNQAQLPVIEDSDFVLGDSNAPVTMFEYSSHFCSHCINFHNQILPSLIEKYIKTGKVKLVPRFVSPLEVNEAILCANDQGYFWQYSDYLFSHSGEITAIDDFKNFAGVLNLDKDQFSQCFDSKKYEEQAKWWFTKAQESQVNYTPTFFINNQRIEGNQPLANFEKVIEEELAKVK